MQSCETAWSLHSPGYTCPRWRSIACKGWAGFCLYIVLIPVQKLWTHVKGKIPPNQPEKPGHYQRRQNAAGAVDAAQCDGWRSRPLGGI